jgi:hypothetical protein
MVGALAAVTAGAITLQCWRRYDPTVGTPMRGDRIYLDRDGLLDAAVDWDEGRATWKAARDEWLHRMEDQLRMV